MANAMIFKPGDLPECCTETFVSKPRVTGCTFRFAKSGALFLAFVLWADLFVRKPFTKFWEKVFLYHRKMPCISYDTKSPSGRMRTRTKGNLPQAAVLGAQSVQAPHE